MQNGGKISHKDWAAKEQYLKYFDLFKVDDKEATVLTGEKDMKRAMQILHEKGAKMVRRSARSLIARQYSILISSSLFRCSGRTTRACCCLMATSSTRQASVLGR
jgi:ATP-dependent exoDNAse (exonuclease V) alpha subunit